MDWHSVLYRWEKYAEKLYPLRDEIADIFKTKCFYDEHWQYQERPYISDDDTVFLPSSRRCSTTFATSLNLTSEYWSRELTLRKDIRANIEQAFEAWKRGLCPLLMKTVPRYVHQDSWNLWQTYDEIAAFLNDRTINYKATQNAILAWELSRSQLNVA